MKNPLSLVLILFVLLFTGCLKPGYVVWDRNGLTFQYPEEFKVSTDLDSYLSNNKNVLIVAKQSISELVENCDWDGMDNLYELEDEYRSTLKDFQKVGISSNIKDVDNLACGRAGGNSYIEDFPVGDNKGVLMYKELAQATGWLDTFYMQLMIVTDFDEVYTITFNFSAYPPVKKLIEDVKESNPYGESYVSEDVYDELHDYFWERDPIDQEHFFDGFLQGEKVFREIIDTVKIKDSAF